MLIDFNGADDFCRKSDIEELTEEIETLKKQKQPDAASKQDVEEVRPAHPAYSHFFGCMFRRSPFALHTFSFTHHFRGCIGDGQNKSKQVNERNKHKSKQRRVCLCMPTLLSVC